MELKKLDSRGVLREFNVSDLDDFLHGSIGLENVLTAAEKQLIVSHELDNIRATENDRGVPGYPAINLHTGQSICESIWFISLLRFHGSNMSFW